MGASQVVKAIKKFSKFLITTHIDLEGDALGSELALVSLLRRLGKQAYIVNSDRVPHNYRFLPGVKGIHFNLNNQNYQAIFVIDCPTKQRIGNLINLIENNKPIINIDHHIGNKNFGSVNWVNPKASSAGEMIYRLFKLTHRRLNKRDALNIYTAILTDTGSFHHSNTTAKTLYICSQLLKLGIESDKIYAKIYENYSVKDIAFLTKVASKLSFASNNRIAWIKINRHDYKKIKTKHEILDRILDFAKSINSVKVVLIFCQLDRQFVKLSLRSKSPINVQKIALIFGGGGHKFASGCIIQGSLKNAEQKVLKEVKRVLYEWDTHR